LLAWGFGVEDSSNLPVEALGAGGDAHGLLDRAQRCVIPALGFYAWRVAANGVRKPYYIQVEDQPLFGFAGFWERDCCIIITVPANAVLAEIDNGELRMPAILAREMRDIWLYGSTARAATALSAYPSERLVVYPVSARVDSLDNNDETLIEPLETNVD